MAYLKISNGHSPQVCLYDYHWLMSTAYNLSCRDSGRF